MKRGPQAARSPSTAGAGWSAFLPWILLAGVVLANAAIRLRLAEVPLERDEGEYAYAGQLILQGVPPYSLAYNMKFPGTYYAYALVMAIFGQSAWAVHAGLALINSATIVLVFLLARRWLSPTAAVAAAAAFAVLAIDRWTMGIFGHATHFVLLPALAGFLVLSDRTAIPGRARCVWAGLLLGLAVLMKQHAATYVVAAAAWLVWRVVRQPDQPRRHAVELVLALGAGALAPFVVMLLVLQRAGVLDRFWFWTFQYAAEYVSQFSLAEAFIALRFSVGSITQATWAIWLLAGAGALALWRGRWPADTRAFVAFLALGSVAALCPGFYFRQHYFIVLLPVLALGAGAACLAIERAVGQAGRPAAGAAVALLTAAAGVALYAAAERDYLFRMPPADVSRSVYPGNPFVESAEVGRYLKAHTAPGDRIAVLGSEPQIYFYADRRSATGHIYTYGLMEPHPFAIQMQQEMIREIELARPAFLVAVQIPLSWLVRPNSDRRIHAWMVRYSSACYDLAGTLDVGKGDTAIRWTTGEADVPPHSAHAIYIFRRRAAEPCAAAPAT
jgi:4-amino-4-deoxy-L-arabinose transferase-like glycosyltransferase